LKPCLLGTSKNVRMLWLTLQLNAVIILNYHKPIYLLIVSDSTLSGSQQINLCTRLVLQWNLKKLKPKKPAPALACTDMKTISPVRVDNEPGSCIILRFSWIQFQLICRAQFQMSGDSSCRKNWKNICQGHEF